MTEQNYSHCYLIENPGYLRVSGQDRLDFLQRQTTNDLRLLTANEPLVTVLTSPTGRIIDVLWVIDEGEDAYGVLTLPGQGDQTASFLNSRIFFMDKVSLENVSAEVLQVELFRDGLADKLRDLGVNGDPNENNRTSITIEEVPVTVLLHPRMSPRLLIPGARADQVISALKDYRILPLSSKEYKILRIESGIPAAGHELVEDYTPLEVGFRWAISDNKGCYTGQEVIARQVNYDKVTKHLIGIRTGDLVRENETLYAQDSGQPVGTVTSAVLSPRFGSIALAVVKRPYHEPKTGLLLKIDNFEMKTVTDELPFA